jgi:hypothetical protein
MERAMTALPAWRDEWSDGCSVPRLLRRLLPWLLPLETEAEREACRRHDEAYYYGGSAADRRRADDEFHARLLAAGMPRPKANVYWGAVRIGGHPAFRVRGVSWAFGGEVFRYTAAPAVPLAL